MYFRNPLAGLGFHRKAKVENWYYIYLGQLTYFLTLLSFLLRNVNWLRGVAIAASCMAIYYSAFAVSQPLWIPVLWNCAFITVNLIHLGLSRWRSRAVKLDPLEDFLGKTVLANFPPAEVKSFTELAQQGTLAQGNQLIRAGSQLDILFCLIKGKVEIVANGKKSAEIGPGFFVGEMSLLTRSLTRADVMALTDLEMLFWRHKDIEKWVDSDAARLGLLQTALGTQVVNQLLSQNEELMAEAELRRVG